MDCVFIAETGSSPVATAGSYGRVLRAVAGRRRRNRKARDHEGVRADTLGLSFVAQQAAALALPGALFFGLTFVMQLLAARDRDLELRPPLLVEIELEGNDGHALTVDRA